MIARSTPEHVLIAGGGIGGLTAAIALGRRGIAATVLERSSFSDQTGAGIQLGPNATSVLRELGALAPIAEQGFRPQELVIFDGLSGKRIASMPLGSAMEQRYGGPYLTLHRADLHAGLLRACRALGTVDLRENVAVTDVEAFDRKIVATTGGGKSREASWMVAADGLWSEIRQRMAPRSLLRHARATAWRTLLPRLSLPAPFNAPIVGLWLGPHAHIVHYPVRAGAALNVVAIVDSGQAEMGWNLETEPTPLLDMVQGWASPLRELLEGAASWRCWSLYRLPRMGAWHQGRIVLIGDAAHPVLPYLAQGAALAIEDAATLASCLQGRVQDPLAAFADYESLRRPRVARVQRMARIYGRLYHWRGPTAAARNAILRRSSPEALLQRLAWLYGNARS